MSEHRKLWPVQYVNRKCQEHEERLGDVSTILDDLVARLVALETKPKRGRKAKEV